MYYVYVLYSLKDAKLYKGFTSDISKRLQRHNRGGNASTAKRKPFILIHLEGFSEKSEALARGRFIKSAEGGVKLRAYLESLGILNGEGKLWLR